MRDKLSRREDRALLRALRELARTRFPNPDRKNCPGTPVLHAIATKRISMLDPAHEHVARCSPCFKELMEMRRTLERRKIFLWAIGTTATAIVVLGVWLTFVGFHRGGGTVRPQTAETPRPSQPTPPVQAGQTGPTVTPAPTTPPPQPQYEIVLLDLRNASVRRSVERPDSNRNLPPVDIRRGMLALTVQLPIGSEAGLYEVEIRGSNRQPIWTAKGEAKIENGITKLSVDVDTRSIRPGQYAFAWRPVDWEWREYPAVIR